MSHANTYLHQAAPAIASVIEAGRLAAARGWLPATSGNLSARVDARHVVITRSGRDKGALTPDDLAVVALDQVLPGDLSAEAPLHLARYRADPAIGAILHAHQPLAALAGRRHQDAGLLLLQGWELQKAFAGETTHDSTLRVPVFANAQDTVTLAQQVEARLAAEPGRLAPGYLLAGHGAYVWGRNGKEAFRHLEALDALLQLQQAWEHTT